MQTSLQNLYFFFRVNALPIANCNPRLRLCAFFHTTLANVVYFQPDPCVSFAFIDWVDIDSCLELTYRHFCHLRILSSKNNYM